MKDFVNRYSLALDYHQNSSVPTRLKHYEPKVHYKIYPNTRVVEMERNKVIRNQQEDDFISTLLQRESTRKFSAENISFDVLARLLTLSFGAQGENKDIVRRTYASAGACYPIEVYLVLLRSDDMERGIYHYNIFDNTLELLRKGDYAEEIYRFYENQRLIEMTLNFPFIILFSMIPERSMQRYGERGYRYALIDAGHMSQNLYLVATYMKIGIVALGRGAEDDSWLDALLKISTNEESVFYGFAVGYPQR